MADTLTTTMDKPQGGNALTRLLRKIYHALGFTRSYNFLLFSVLSGALLGFTLSRLMYLSYYTHFCGGHNVPGVGECFYYGKGALLQPAMLAHLATALPACLLVVVQFVPVVRRRWLLLHRLNGYLVLALFVPAAVTGMVIRRGAFGGEVSTRSAVVVLGTWSLTCVALAWWNIKRLQIEQHRAWMLRGFVAAASIITMRLLQIITSKISPLEGGVYQARACSQISYILGQNRTLALYPACAAFYSGADPDFHVAVKAVWPPAAGHTGPLGVAAALGSAFGPAAWMALALHVLAVEIYLHLTTAEHEHLRNVSFARQQEAGMAHPGSAGLTADKLGDAPRWMPASDAAAPHTSGRHPDEHEPSTTAVSSGRIVDQIPLQVLEPRPTSPSHENK